MPPIGRSKPRQVFDVGRRCWGVGEGGTGKKPIAAGKVGIPTGTGNPIKTSSVAGTDFITNYEAEEAWQAAGPSEKELTTTIGQSHAREIESLRGSFVVKTHRYFPQDVVYVLGGGPSLKDMDLSVLHSKFVIGCNDAYRFGSRVCDVVMWGDTKWWRAHGRTLCNFYDGLIVSLNSRAKPQARVRWIQRHSGALINDDSGCGWNNSTGAAATNLALLFGAKTVVLLGFDMGLSGKSSNWHPNNLSSPSNNDYSRFMGGFKTIANELPVKFPDSTIINANLGSAMTCFPKISREEALEMF